MRSKMQSDSLQDIIAEEKNHIQELESSKHKIFWTSNTNQLGYGWISRNLKGLQIW